MKILKNLQVVTIMCFSWLGLCQENDFIVGILLESSTNDPIVFATIQIKDQNNGVISNMDGSFKIPSSYISDSTELLISCIGYKSLEVHGSQLHPIKPNLLYMDMEAIDLANVTLYAEKRKKMSAKRIVKKSVESIADNYDTNPFSLLGYYREYQEENGEYVNLSEASLEIIDKGFDNIDLLNTQVKIYNRQTVEGFRIDTTARLPYDYQTGIKTIERAFLEGYGGNEFMILRVHDPIRNYNINSFDFVNRLESDFVRNHSFSILGTQQLDSEPMYVIGFKRNHIDYRVDGRLHISKIDYAIHKFEYAFKKNLSNSSIDEGSGPDGLDRPLFKTVTEYRRIGDKMYLNYSSFQNTFSIQVPGKFRTQEIGVLPDQKSIRIRFSETPSKESAKKKGAYSVKFRNKRIRIKSVQVQGPLVFLYPDIDEETLISSLTERDEKNDDKDGAAGPLEINVNNVLSDEGEALDQFLTKTLYQFRELFVQKVILEPQRDMEGPFMDREKPIFGPQPIAVPEGETQMWMNTPIKKQRLSNR